MVMRIIPRALPRALLAFGIASPAAAMDDQAAYYRFDLLAEKRITSLAPATEWNALGWAGGDDWKLRLQSAGVLTDSGQIDNEGGTKGIDSRLYLSRMIAPFWDAKAGVQVAVFDRGLHRSGFLAGVEGLVPYGIRLDAVAGVSETGVASLRVEAEYGILLSQRLVAQPFVEGMLASQDDPSIRLGAGLSRIEGGLRLRYEIEKEFAPFVGVSFEQFTGNTAGLVAGDGEATSSLRALVGLKIWF
jgi:copper resistance protein B